VPYPSVVILVDMACHVNLLPHWKAEVKGFFSIFFDEILKSAIVEAAAWNVFITSFLPVIGGRLARKN
jgi:hypothetical protein